jgi:hypothetical protein
MTEEINFTLRDGYNAHNWYTGVVHACKPKWKQWSDVPEKIRNLHASQSGYYETLCGTGNTGNNLTTKREVTCMRCLRIMKKEYDKEKLSQKTFEVWENKDWNSLFPFGGMDKRKQIFKQL